MTGDEERTALILRRTLGTISGLYALWSLLLGWTAWSQRSQALVDYRLLLLHGALLGTAAVLLRKPRRGALLFTLLAIAGSVAFAVLDLLRHQLQAALVDGLYALIAAVLLYKSRRRA